ncbi:MAG TPA: hypothetical protein VK028_11035 [Micromonosporaceae bacterium]|nr:hypothetical protein [Micromonosporaceae bacterium]
MTAPDPSRSYEPSRPYGPSRSYEVVVEGVLDDQWSHWIGGHALTFVDGNSIIGPLVDESALHAVLIKVRDLGLRLVSVRRAGSAD